MGLFIFTLLIVPLLDVFYLWGQIGLYDEFYVTIEAMGLYGLADALVQGGVIDVADEMLEHHMQAVVAGTTVSGQFSAFVAMRFGSEERRTAEK